MGVDHAIVVETDVARVAGRLQDDHRGSLSLGVAGENQDVLELSVNSGKPIPVRHLVLGLGRLNIT